MRASIRLACASIVPSSSPPIRSPSPLRLAHTYNLYGPGVSPLCAFSDPSRLAPGSPYQKARALVATRMKTHPSKFHAERNKKPKKMQSPRETPQEPSIIKILPKQRRHATPHPNSPRVVRFYSVHTHYFSPCQLPRRGHAGPRSPRRHAKKSF